MEILAYTNTTKHKLPACLMSYLTYKNELCESLRKYYMILKELPKSQENFMGSRTCNNYIFMCLDTVGIKLGSTLIWRR